MILKMTVAITGMAILLFNRAGIAQQVDQNVIIHFRADGKCIQSIALKLSKESKHKEQLEENVKKLNPTIEKDCQRIGTDIPVTINRSMIDLIKLKAYYLEVAGGKGYTEDLYQEEKKRTEWAKSFDDQTIYNLSYSYMPIYQANSASAKSSGKFNSLLGLNAEVEHQWNGHELPFFLSFAATYRRWSNVQAISQTSPEEQQETISLDPTLNFSLSMGLSKRLSPWRLFTELSKETNYLPDYVAADDQSSIIEDVRYLLSLGIQYAYQSNKRGKARMMVEAKIGTSLIASSTETYNSSAVNAKTLEERNALRLELSPKYQMENGNFVQYQADYISWGKGSAIQAHQISLGRTF